MTMIRLDPSTEQETFVSTAEKMCLRLVALFGPMHGLYMQETITGELQ